MNRCRTPIHRRAAAQTRRSPQARATALASEVKLCGLRLRLELATVPVTVLLPLAAALALDLAPALALDWALAQARALAQAWARLAAPRLCHGGLTPPLAASKALLYLALPLAAYAMAAIHHGGRVGLLGPTRRAVVAQDGHQSTLDRKTFLS
jgi:hypothetical protein